MGGYGNIFRLSPDLNILEVPNTDLGVCVCAPVCVRVRVCVSVCVHMSVCTHSTDTRTHSKTTIFNTPALKYRTVCTLYQKCIMCLNTQLLLVHGNPSRYLLPPPLTCATAASYMAPHLPTHYYHLLASPPQAHA